MWTKQQAKCFEHLQKQTGEGLDSVKQVSASQYSFTDRSMSVLLCDSAMLHVVMSACRSPGSSMG